MRQAFPIGKVQRDRRGAAVVSSSPNEPLSQNLFPIEFSRNCLPDMENENLMMARTAGFRIVHVQTERPGLGGSGRLWPDAYGATADIAAEIGSRQNEFMSIFSRLFGRPARRSKPVQPVADRFDVQRGVSVAANSDIISGWQFCATAQLRTPLRVLSRHGEVSEGLDRPPPIIVHEQWEGIWVHKLRSWKEMGFAFQELQNETMASSIGQIPIDGGEYLKFLIAVRTVAEANGEVTDRRKAVADVIVAPAWREFVRAHEGIDAILDQLFPPFLSTVPRLAAKTCHALIAAGFATPASIDATSDAALKLIDGVGPALVKALREAASGAAEQEAAYVDRVLR